MFQTTNQDIIPFFGLVCELWKGFIGSMHHTSSSTLTWKILHVWIQFFGKPWLYNVLVYLRVEPA